jgi:long-chain acyl-CoA synthetase
VSPPPNILRYETLIEDAGDAEVAEYRRRSKEVGGDRLATIIYTSGTTGEPKGVMLSHANLSSNALDALEEFDLCPSDPALSFLPLAHVFERTADYTFLFHRISVAYVDQVETVAQALLEVHPTIPAAIPRFFGKMYANILERGHQETGLRRRIFAWALRAAEKAERWRVYGKGVSLGVRLQWRIANSLVYSKVRAGLGGRIRVFCSGGGPLAPELWTFFWSLGVPVYEGYGLTDTSPVVMENRPGAHRISTVSRPIPNVDVRIAVDGEILVKTLCAMQGYYNKPKDTDQVFTSDGWFCTGNIGRLDEDGYLIITDRKRELIKTAAGKLVAPAPIGKMLKTSQFIANAIVVGDKRKFICALIGPNFAAFEIEALKNGRKLAPPEQVITDPWARNFYAREVERFTAGFALYEKPKRFALLDEDFTFARGELTYTLKMTRRIVEQRYQEVIARHYADVQDPRPHLMA